MPRGKIQKTDGRMILAWRSIRKDGQPPVDVAKRHGISAGTVVKWCIEVDKDVELLSAASSDRKITPSVNNVSKRHEIIKKNKSDGVKKAVESNKGRSGTKKSAKKDLSYVARLEDELAFMKWWNEAERNGYIERLLKKLQQG